jgi:hypothetical protein
MGRCVNKGGILAGNAEEETGKLAHLASWVLGRR